MIGLENPSCEREEQDGPGQRRTPDTKCETERERVMVERKRQKSSTICQMHVRCTDL
jgi:hypothetical protein